MGFGELVRRFFGPDDVRHFVNFGLPGLTEQERNDPKVLEQQAQRLAALLKGRGLNVVEVFGVEELRIISVEFGPDETILVDLSPTKTKGEWCSQIAVIHLAMLSEARGRQLEALARVDAELHTTLRLDLKAERIEWFDGPKRIRRGEGSPNPPPPRGS